MSEANHAIVIGAEAAGVLAAITAAGKGAEMELWEQNEKPGKKLFITDKGRCSVTDACDMEELFGPVVNNSKFLHSSFHGFTNQDMMDLLERARLRLKVGCDSRVFPRSDKSSDVISTLSSLMRQVGVKVRLNQKADGLAVEDGACKGVRYGGRIQTADRVIMATDGLSYPTAGSTGGGLEWALDNSHKLTELSPALVPFEVKGIGTVKGLQGLSLENVEAAIYDGKKGLYQEFREMLFTHFGVSGSVLLSTGSFCAKAIRKRHLRLVIDLKPTLSWEQLDERILRDSSDSRNKQFKNALNHLYPVKLIPVIITRSGVNPGKEMNEVTREERRGLAKATKSLKFTLTGLRGCKEATITQGGIFAKDVNPSTIESKKVRSLYFTGGILDLGAVTGDSSLQVAWSAGWAAGKTTASQHRRHRDFLARQNT